MAELFLDDLDIDAGVEGHGRGAVAHVVQPDRWEAGSADETPEAGGDGVGVPGFAVGVGANVTVAITNTGPTVIDGWTLRWSDLAGQPVTDGWGATAARTGATVTLTAAGYSRRIGPGETVTVGYIAEQPAGYAHPPRELFRLPWAACD